LLDQRDGVVWILFREEVTALGRPTTGPITWQIRDHAGLTSVTEILHRAYTSAIAVFPDGAQHQDDPITGDHDAA
jgi:hypothetical protein